MSDAPAPNAPSWVQSVLPSDIVQQRQLGWPDFHPEDFCHVCGRRNPVWSAPAADWDAVINGHGGIFCPSCFADLYDSTQTRPALWQFSTIRPGVPLSVDQLDARLGEVIDDLDTRINHDFTELVGLRGMLCDARRLLHLKLDPK